MIQGNVIRYPGNFTPVEHPREGGTMEADVRESRSLARIYDLRQYALTKRVLFNFGILGQDEKDEEALHIPIGIVYRLHFLGRAYNFSAVKLIEPQGRSYLGYKTCQQLIVELEQLRTLLKDPVIEHYTRKLVNYLISNRGVPEYGLMVRSL
ncbi:MAG: hypothetical protein R3F41_00785 [Gammaproteobacteria bacterium]|nr:hypothetical protein [Pseudomonadales bacterium]MCP5346153.1 hypothetical protein [Pseudomonadales bacterium]